jgi:hypothetical protein
LGSSSKQETHQVSSNKIDDQQMAQYQGNYGTAQGVADKISNPYTGELVAGFSPTQIQAQGILSTLAQNPLYQNQIQTAANSIQGILGSNPLSADNLQQFMNPFQSDVIDASIAQNERARQIAQNQINMQNTAGAAFGGSRSGVANALTNEAYDRNNQANIANLNAANFSQAQQAALNNAGLQLGAAGQLVGTAGAGYNQALNQGGLLSNVGDVQQQQAQAVDNAEFQRFLQNNQNLLNAQAVRNQALGMIPVQQTNTTDATTKTSSNPGLAGILGAVGGLAMSAAVPGSAGLFGSTSLLGSLFGKSAGNTMANSLPYLNNGMGGLGG